ncbi:MAG: CmpA/NrtA family ABC transporter substrate-binding protein [Roseobacter sp.]
MRRAALSVGFIPLVDAAPVIVAQEMGFAAEEGISLDLRRAPSWSSLRDMISFGQVDAAHMLSTLPVATAMGLGGISTSLAAVSVLSMNGNVIGVSREIETRLRQNGYRFDFQDARAAGKALLNVSPKTLRIGVPFPFSMHAELVHYWLSTVDKAQGESIQIRTVPPPLMTEAIEAGEIDAFCVGEPWGSRTVDKGVGALLLPGTAIWAFSPEKVLAVRREWAETEQSLLNRLIRATWRAGRWLAKDGSNLLATELLSRPEYLDLPPEIIERSLSGRLVISAGGEERYTPRFVEFSHGAASFPWRSQAEWIGQQLASRTGSDPTAARATASSVFRSDLFRMALDGTDADLPGASSKLEGSLEHDTSVASAGGQMILYKDRFFDGRIFEPDATNRT